MRVVALTARSRFTEEEVRRAPRFVRRRVSGDTPTVKWVGVKEVMVRHVPALVNLSAEEASRDGRKDLETGNLVEV